MPERCAIHERPRQPDDIPGVTTGQDIGEIKALMLGRSVTTKSLATVGSADLPPTEHTMAGWYEVSTNDKGQYSFVLKASNGQVVLRSEQYEAKASALNGIASVQKNSPLDERYELNTASDGRAYFNLKAGNAQVIGTSQMYASEANRSVGVESVKANGASTDIREA